MYTLAMPGTSVELPIEPGTLLLVGGPSTDGKRRLTLSVPAAAHAGGARALLVTTDAARGTMLRQFRTQARRAGALDPGRFAIAASETAGEDDRASAALAAAGEDGRIQGFSSATAFAELGSALSDAFAAMDDADRYWVVYDSLSDVIEQGTPKTAYKLCHVLSERLAETGGAGMVVLDDGHQPETVGLLRDAIDGVVRTRPADKLADGDCEFRIPAAETGWRRVDTDPARGDDSESKGPRRERLEDV
jgi:KaiC/GvpD/RAD55 family RecA-like ATPase